MSLSKLSIIKRALDRAKAANAELGKASAHARKAGIRSPALDAAEANIKSVESDLILAQEKARATG